MYKHQMDSYRTRNGERFECFTDVLDESLGDLRTQARQIASDLRAQGHKAFIEKQEDFYRVFATP